MLQQTSPTGRDEARHGEAGFTLVEIVCVVAILAIVSAIVLPGLPRGTSRARLESYAIATAALLRTDRNAALRRAMTIATAVDAERRLIRSGATGQIVSVPGDVAFDALLSGRCNQHADNYQIVFFSFGTSCGGVIALSRPGIAYEIRVNWLTGEIDIVPRAPA